MEPFYKEPMATIFCGDALEVLKELPDESVQMCMSSPPYWGLRAYAGGKDIVWGGDESCEHEWGAEVIVPRQSNPDTGLANTGTGAPRTRTSGAT